MKHAFCVDVEDWYHSLDAGVPERERLNYDSRVMQNVTRIIELLSEYNTHATFFVVTELAKRLPALLPTIVQAGHELASHTHTHRLLHTFTPQTFETDLNTSLDILREATNKAILGFRAPCWSVTPHQQWVFDVLQRTGLTYDASILPLKRFLYLRGLPDIAPHLHQLPNGLVELPLSTIPGRIFPVPFALAAILRILPYSLTRHYRRHFVSITKAPFSVNIHPWELDIDQPRHPMPVCKQFLHYAGRHSLEAKLRRLLQSHTFAPVRDVIAAIFPSTGAAQP